MMVKQNEPDTRFIQFTVKDNAVGCPEGDLTDIWETKSGGRGDYTYISIGDGSVLSVDSL